jgi:hypothetical protein
VAPDEDRLTHHLFDAFSFVHPHSIDLVLDFFRHFFFLPCTAEQSRLALKIFALAAPVSRAAEPSPQSSAAYGSVERLLLSAARALASNFRECARPTRH